MSPFFMPCSSQKPPETSKTVSPNPWYDSQFFLSLHGWQLEWILVIVVPSMKIMSNGMIQLYIQKLCSVRSGIKNNIPSKDSSNLFPIIPSVMDFLVEETLTFKILFFIITFIPYKYT